MVIRGDLLILSYHFWVVNYSGCLSWGGGVLYEGKIGVGVCGEIDIGCSGGRNGIF